MKLYSHTVLIAALAIPAFCQDPSSIRKTDQAAALADQANQLSLQAEKMAATVKAGSAGFEALSAEKMMALEDQVARAADRFDSSKITDLLDKATAAEEKFHSLDDLRFDSLNDLKFHTVDDIDAKMAQFDFQFDSSKFTDMEAAAAKLAGQVDMAFFQGAKPFPPEGPMGPVGPVAPKARTFSSGRVDSEYDAGQRAMDQRRWDEAVQRFDSVINMKGARTDGALYWKAYALNRLGKRDEALAAIASLRRDYTSSAYLNEAEALEAEVKQNAGEPVSPAQEGNDDMKLIAINALMGADAERAIPLVEGMLKGTAAPNVKDRALFVLAQSRSPRAQQVLSSYAKGAGNPDLQLRAIQYVGMSRTRESQQLLVSIYSSSADTRVKNTILQSLVESRAMDALMNIARTEKDTSLRDSAIRHLASEKTVPVEGLLELYNTSDAQAKRAILDGLMSRRDAKTLVDLAHKETDPAIKRAIVDLLGSMHNSKEAMDYMAELIRQ